MWKLETRVLQGCSILAASVVADTGSRLSFAEVFMAWRQSEAFGRLWSAGLRELPFSGYCWELPPLTLSSSSRPFECVFVESPTLATVRADPSPFEEHLRAAGRAEVLAFENLGRDATLVVPR